MVQIQLTEIRTEFKADLEKLRDEMEKGFRRLKHMFELQSVSLAELHSDWRDHEEGLDRLEKS